MKCEHCSQTKLLFEDEWQRFWKTEGACSKDWEHRWLKQPPRVSVILATTGLMLDDPQLDSLITIYELDRQLTMEARDEKEMEIFQQVRRNT